MSGNHDQRVQLPQYFEGSAIFPASSADKHVGQKIVNPRIRSIYGALDLGTNNCRLLLAQPNESGFKIIDAFSRITRLGEGVYRTRHLSEAAMIRTICALKVCTEKLARSNVQRARLIATEACRFAKNGQEFVTRVHEETGLQLEVISREVEAQLAVASCSPLLNFSCRSSLVFDIGGGSSEIILVGIEPGGTCAETVPYKPIHKILDWVSLPVGVVSLAEKYGEIGINRLLFETMVNDVSSHLMAFRQSACVAAASDDPESMHFIGISGTMTTLAGIHLNLKRYDRARVDGCSLTSDQVRDVSEKVLNMGFKRRVKSPCIGPGRADLVVAGCAILEAIMRAWSCQRIQVADRGLREGMLSQLMNEDGYVINPQLSLC